jgi:hypothetical protein
MKTTMNLEAVMPLRQATESSSTCFSTFLKSLLVEDRVEHEPEYVPDFAFGQGLFDEMSSDPAVFPDVQLCPLADGRGFRRAARKRSGRPRGSRRTCRPIPCAAS